jgi:hypothetical protein
MQKYHRCSICDKCLLEWKLSFGFIRNAYLGDEIRICSECYFSAVPKHIPETQIRRYVKRIIERRNNVV